MEDFMKMDINISRIIPLIGIASIVSGCCTLFPSSPGCKEPVIEDYAFTPASITRLCPTHIGGDREFKGHGPDVKVDATIRTRNSDREIWVTLHLHAKETRSDWTEAEGTWERKLWTAPTGKRIASIESDRFSEASYRDTNHSLDRPSVRGGALVSKFEVMGDTGGNDVRNCTSDDVYMNVYFNDIQVKLRPE
jgi:hypothetical protein